MKFVGVAWVRSGEGFYYTRFPAPGSVAAGDEHYFNRVCYHRLGDAQDQDALIFDKPGQRETVFAVETSDDDRWVVITAFSGSSDKSEVYLLDRRARRLTAGAAVHRVLGRVRVRRIRRRAAVLPHRQGAPRGRDHRRRSGEPGTAAVVEVVRRIGRTSSRRCIIVSGTLVVCYLHNASDQIRLFDLSRSRRLARLSCPRSDR